MLNKVSYKVGALLFFTIASYFILINFIIIPKTINYVKENEENNAKIELNSVSNYLSTKAEFSSNISKQDLISQKKRIKDLVNIVDSIFSNSYDEFKQGKINKEKALKRAIFEISNFRFINKLDYVFILNTDGKALYHPNKEFENKNLITLTDLDNKFFVKNLISNTVKNNTTYTKYKWHENDKQNIVNKLAYSKYQKEFGLIIVSSIYLDKIKNNEEIRKYVSQKEIIKYFKSLKTEKGFFHLLDTDLNFLYHEEKSLINQNIDKYLLTNRNNDIFSLVKEASVNNKKISSNINNKTLNSWFYFNEYYDFYVMYSNYEEEMFKNANEIKSIIISFSIALFFVLLLIGIYLINKLVKPINELILNSNKVKNGDFSIRNSMHSGDEIGILSEQFNFMLDKIEYNIKNLEHEVNIRTEELQKKIYYDPLTGSLNRSAFLRDIKDKNFTTLILVDINSFDDVNELYGFDIGNDLLKEVSKILTKFAEKNNLRIYKVYGDVFALLELNEYFTLERLETFIKELNSIFYDNKVVLEEHDLELNVPISLGISIAQEFPLKTANIALRNAKRSDRNFSIYNNELDLKEQIKESKYWENKIKESILKKDIVPFYQAIYNRDGEIIKYEALMRMKDNEKNTEKFISPDKFLDFAKKSKQYNEVNLQLINKVLEKVKETNRQISINISFKSIQNTNFRKVFDTMIDELDNKYYSKLVFEILESEFVWDYKILEDFIVKYKNMGIKIAIDDFGSGYSNFKHILNVKPDYLKIDGSLIKNIDENKDSYELVKYISLFAKAIGIKTVAEFVHSEKIYDILYNLEIDEFQGFYLGLPKNDLYD